MDTGFGARRCKTKHFQRVALARRKVGRVARLRVVSVAKGGPAKRVWKASVRLQQCYAVPGV
eukprot:4683376-Lingulodinium_polyedra.AAC.1